uniref:glucuronosyltransferase n=1 Tax=Pristionchus pacificus TaxID=54126 RepID=A0A8R1Z6S1_PRIPA
MQLAHFLIFLTILTEADPYKVLVYNSKFGFSHSNFLGNIADILVEQGHNVTSLIPIIDPEVRDGTSKSTKIFIPQALETRKILSVMRERKAEYFSMSNYDPFNTLLVGKISDTLLVAQCKAVLEDTKVLKQLQADQFDVMIVENFDMCGVAFAYLVNPKSLITSSASTPFSFMFEEFGIPLALSYNPTSYMSFLDVHSVFERVKNIYGEILMHALLYPGRWMIEELYRDKFGNSFPSLQEISSHAAFTFTNSEPLIDFAAPTLNRVIAIGGIGAKTPIALDQYWSDVVSRRSQTILLSFGSVAKSITLPKAIKQSILKTISAFPNVTFIWKYEQPEDDFGKCASHTHPNLVLTSWTPQNDLLNDRRITAFITHGGMGSTQETALRGIPGIFIPIFGDQPRNAGMMQHNGFGKVLDKFDLKNPETFIAAIKDVLNNDSYRENAAKVSRMLAKKPFSSKELMIRTVEFAAEFGPSRALRPLSYDMNFVEYHNLDIIALSLLLFLFLIYLLTMSIHISFSKNNVKEKKQ